MARQRRRSIFRKIGDIVLTFAGFVAIAWFIVWLETRNPNTMTGNARALDGDSLIVDGQKIRLKGIDAPEFNQTCNNDGQVWNCGQEARDALRKLVRSQQVICKAGTVDIYDRWLATCTAGGKDINRTLVENGWAVDYGGYAVAERYARKRARGIWAGSFETPQDWRRAHKGDVHAGKGAANMFRLFWVRTKRWFHSYFS